jgi:hypothetical protein
MTAGVAAKSTRPVTVLVADAFAELAEIRPDVTASDPAVVMPGAVPEPPMLFTVNSLTVLFPKKVSVEAPLMVTAFVGAICPEEFVIVTVAALMVSPPAGIDA